MTLDATEVKESAWKHVLSMFLSHIMSDSSIMHDHIRVQDFAETPYQAEDVRHIRDLENPHEGKEEMTKQLLEMSQLYQTLTN